MPSYRKLRSGNIQAIVRVQGYPQRSKTFSTKTLARQWALRLEETLRSGVVSSAGLMVQDIIERYLTRDPDYKYLKRDLYTARQQIKIWRGVRVDEFTALHIREYMRQRLQVVSTSTVRKDVGFIRRAWNYSRKQGYELPVLFDSIQLPEENNPPQRIPTESELDAILGDCSPILAAVVEFASLTGMRRSEILSITRDCVDLESRVVILRSTKNGDQRIVPVCSRAHQILQDHACNFCMRPDSVTQGFRRVCQRLGIEGLVFHSLRHYAVTRYDRLGLSAIQIARVVGHKSLAMTLRYSHPDIEVIHRMLE